MSASPTVSVIVPVFNEQDAIGECLARIGRQSFRDYEVLVADGGSTDATRALVDAVARGDERVRLVDNPGRVQSAGLNRALREASGAMVIRLDARSFVDDDYLATCVDLLERTGAANVGGRMVPRPGASVVEQGIALANRSAWGAGPARFHVDGGAGPADTVYLGAFDRSWLEKVGGWAEDVGVNEDFELNHRIRAAGGVVWFDPALVVEYQPRRTYAALAKQYFRYGRSKATVIRRHPGSLKPRQAAPMVLAPIGVAAVLPTRFRGLARAAAVAYLVAVAFGAARAPGALKVRAAGGVAAVVMHWSWSLGALVGVARPVARAGS